MSYDLIIFDCDGVLVDSEPVSNRIIAEEFSRLGLPMSAEEALQLFAGTSIGYAIEYFQEQTGKQAPSNLEALYRQRSMEAFKRELKAVRGVRAVLEEIHIPKCVASNGPRHKIAFNLQLTHLDQHFSTKQMFSAYDVGHWKPEPQLYLHVAAAMSAEPRRCLVIEDSLAGVLAARRAGMQVMGYAATTDPDQLSAEGAQVFYAMEELLEPQFGLIR